MSSVGSSDSSGRPDEVARRAREEAKKSEIENAKKYKTDVRRLNEQQHREIERLKSQHAEQMNSMRGQSNDVISKRDHEYQKDMEKMRDMHSKQLAAAKEEGQRKEQALRDSIGSDNEHSKATNKARFEKLSGEYEENLREKDRTLTEGLNNAHEGQKEGIAENRRKLERASNVQIESIKAERDATVGHLQKTLTDTRENAGERIRDLEIDKMRQKERDSDSLMHAVRNERELRQESEGILREGFQDGLGRTKDRYEMAAKKERDAKNAAARDLKGSVSERIDNQVRRLEKENVDLKEGRVRSEILQKQRQERELDNIRTAWGKNINHLQEQRDELLHSTNDSHAKDVSQVVEQKNKEATDTNRFYREKMDENNQVNRTAFNNLVGDFEGRNQYTQQLADQRVKNIFENSVDDKTNLIKNHELTTHSMQRQSKDELKAMRIQLENEKAEAVIRVQEQLRKQEMQHAEKMNTVVQKYEKQVQSLYDQVAKEKKAGEENLKRTVTNLQRSHQLTIDQMEAKNRDRMRQVTTQQAEEIRSVNKRNDEKIDAVLTEIKKT